jgi:Kef-type K+ transport system membrane component KefB
MHESEIALFFLQIAVMLAVGFLCGQGMRKIGQPAVLGELIGGILLGPSVFGLLFRQGYASLFPSTGMTSELRDGVVRIGMMFFLFIAGLEIDLDRVRRNGRASFSTSLLGMAVPFALGAGSVLLLPGLWGHPAEAVRAFAIFVGAALSISALPVIVRILLDLNLLETREGTVTVTSAVIDDLTGWSLFAFSLGLLAPASQGRPPWLSLVLVLLLAAGMVALGRFAGARFFEWTRALVGEAGGLLAVVSILVLLGAFLAQIAGVHAVFGAFLVGVALGPSLKHTPCASVVIRQFALSFFAPLYFVSVGLKADFIRGFDPVLVAVVLVIASAGKILGAGAGALLGGMKLREAGAVAVGLNARGAMEIILAGVALSAGIIDQRIFVALIFMTVVTTLASGPLFKRLCTPGEAPPGDPRDACARAISRPST